MRSFTPLILIGICLSLISAKCRTPDTSSFVAKAEKYTVAGGVYGSGYSLHYEILFTDKVKDSIAMDSIYISASTDKAYRKLASERGWGIRKTKEGVYFLDCIFNGGERMQSDGNIRMVQIIHYNKPAGMGENEGIIFGKYRGKAVTVAIKTFKRTEHISLP